MSLLEIAAVVVSLVSVWLTVRENIWCWPAGIVSVALYAVVFFEAKLYADTGLQAVYAALSIYGWWEWIHGGAAGGRLAVTRVAPKTLLVAGTLGALFAAGLGIALSKTTDASLPFADSTLTSYSLVAQWLMTKKHLENWWVWIAVDALYVGLFCYKFLYLTAGLYAVFLALAIVGFLKWRRSLATPRPS